jgi:hypothetical protein
LGFIGCLFAKENPGEGLNFVVISHYPDNLRTQLTGEGLYEVNQRFVRFDLTTLGQIPGENQGINAVFGQQNTLKECFQSRGDIDGTIELPITSEEVGVTDV